MMHAGVLPAAGNAARDFYHTVDARDALHDCEPASVLLICLIMMMMITEFVRVKSLT